MCEPAGTLYGFPVTQMMLKRIGVSLQDEMPGVDVGLFAQIPIVRVDGNPEMLVKEFAVLQTLSAAARDVAADITTG